MGSLRLGMHSFQFCRATTLCPEGCEKELSDRQGDRKESLTTPRFGPCLCISTIRHHHRRPSIPSSLSPPNSYFASTYLSPRQYRSYLLPSVAKMPPDRPIKPTLGLAIMFIPILVIGITVGVFPDFVIACCQWLSALFTVCWQSLPRPVTDSGQRLIAFILFIWSGFAFYVVACPKWLWFYANMAPLMCLEEAYLSQYRSPRCDRLGEVDAQRDDDLDDSNIDASGLHDDQGIDSSAESQSSTEDDDRIIPGENEEEEEDEEDKGVRVENKRNPRNYGQKMRRKVNKNNKRNR